MVTYLGRCSEGPSLENTKNRNITTLGTKDLFVISRKSTVLREMRWRESHFFHVWRTLKTGRGVEGLAQSDRSQFVSLKYKQNFSFSHTHIAKLYFFYMRDSHSRQTQHHSGNLLYSATQPLTARATPITKRPTLFTIGDGFV